MASSSLGLFGDFKYTYSTGKKTQPSVKTVWVSRKYDPLDVRDSAPVPEKKTINTPQDPNELPPEWVSFKNLLLALTVDIRLFKKNTDIQILN